MHRVSITVMMAAIISACVSLPPVETGGGISAGALAQLSSGTFVIGPEAAEVEFAVAPKGLGLIEGIFPNFEARLVLTDAVNGIANVEARVDTTSIHLENRRFEKLVRGPGWFEVDTYPTAYFRGDLVGWEADGTGVLRGTMTTRDVTQDETMVFRLTCDGIAECPEKAVGFSGELRISRAAYGMVRLPRIVGDEVKLSVTGLLISPNANAQ